MVVRLEPIADRVVLKRLDSTNEIGGIILPESEMQQFVRAEVIAVGPGKFGDDGSRLPMQTKVGDICLVNALACAPCDLPVDLDGEFLLIPEKDIAAIIREE